MLFPEQPVSRATMGAAPMEVPAAKPQARGGFTFSPPTAPAAGQPTTSPEEAEWVAHVRKAQAAERSVKSLDAVVTDLNSRIRSAKSVPLQARLQAALAKVLDERKRADEQSGEETILSAVAQRKVEEAKKAGEAKAARMGELAQYSQLVAMLQGVADEDVMMGGFAVQQGATAQEALTRVKDMIEARKPKAPPKKEPTDADKMKEAALKGVTGAIEDYTGGLTRKGLGIERKPKDEMTAEEKAREAEGVESARERIDPEKALGSARRKLNEMLHDRGPLGVSVPRGLQPSEFTSEEIRALKNADLSPEERTIVDALTKARPESGYPSWLPEVNRADWDSLSPAGKATMLKEKGR